MSVNFFVIAALAAASAWAQVPTGRWDGVVDYGTLKVPFRIDLEGTGSLVTGIFVNGHVRTASTAGAYEGDRLSLVFAQKLVAKLDHGELKGTYGPHPFTATAYCTCGVEGVAGPAITGTWELPALGWRFEIERKGEDTHLMLTRPEGKLGPMNGRYDGLSFQLHYFDGSKAALLDLEERRDGGLGVIWKESGRDAVETRAVRAK